MTPSLPKNGDRPRQMPACGRRDATQAAIRAGYSRRNADKIGPDLLGKTRVSKAVAEAMAARSKRTAIEADRVLQEVATVGFSDIGDVLDFTGPQPRLRRANEIPAAARRAISSMKVKRYVEGKGDDAREVEVVEFRFWSKDAALEKLMKHLGILVEKVASTDPTGKKEFGGNGLTDEKRLARMLELLELARARRAQALERNGEHTALAPLQGGPAS